ncbi:Acg family FMN-binding oxidoreductase [Nocardia seriolae]|uniref:NAD(P)H nitroreductase acg n=1 Tax=Nocardia seriolae TaxID=37332 RepID=A0A0B8NL36_9NOCA|nr:hypothetical protein [Nocardia seriolae]MTJ64086.1 hypothetical protein [Nocardia seriolae]MTJ73661.1 hypothetical protein [Nocardia seriolae]MTJ88135.1 hypothetical protein [Nocardia seriolae]MTK32124.1 hypothetical protein [Nocardia seriolae]MTK41972.1 hypothetical protein [Nocardia seriolae]
MTIGEFPTTTTVPDDETLLAAVRLAARAPSVHNSQPWRWVFDGTRLHLYGDSDRQLYATDPHGRQWVISCGAALHHMRIAFAARGWHTDTVRLPDQDRPNHLATIRFHPGPRADATAERQAHAIELRYTDRLPLREPDGWRELVPRLRQLAAPHDVAFDVLNGNGRMRLIDASRKAAAARRYDPMYRDELNSWAGGSEVLEGVPAAALVSETERHRVEIARAFPAAEDAERRAGLTDAAALAVLGTHDDSPLRWLHTGEALSAVLLECAAAGLASCALTHVTELPATRRDLADLLPHRILPQVVLRVGGAPESEQRPQTPRLPLSEIFTVERG